MVDGSVNVNEWRRLAVFGLVREVVDIPGES